MPPIRIQKKPLQLITSITVFAQTITAHPMVIYKTNVCLSKRSRSMAFRVAANAQHPHSIPKMTHAITGCSGRSAASNIGV